MRNDATPSVIMDAARRHILDELKGDHLRVKQAFQQFQAQDLSTPAAGQEALVAHVLDELTVHAALEQELLYPALREAPDMEVGVLEAAERDHTALHALINPLRTLKLDDGQHPALFAELCQRALRHMKWEETQLFPGLARMDLDWVRLEGEIDQRREELVVAEGQIASTLPVIGSTTPVM